jgi:hypothetical protein
LDVLVVWCGVTVAVAGGLAALARFTRGARRFIRRSEQFWEDWQGTEERPGVPARPGVMERLDRIEHELHPNSGQSMRDVINRIEGAVGATPEK